MFIIFVLLFIPLRVQAEENNNVILDNSNKESIELKNVDKKIGEGDKKQPDSNVNDESTVKNNEENLRDEGVKKEDNFDKDKSEEEKSSDTPTEDKTENTPIEKKQPIIVNDINNTNNKKQWYIKFNKMIDKDSIDENILKLYDSNEKEVSFKSILSNDNKAFIITFMDELLPNQIYYLHINDGIKSLDGQCYLESLILKFSNIIAPNDNLSEKNIVVDRTGNTINGIGKVEYKNGDIYDGEFINGKFSDGNIRNRRNERWPQIKNSSDYIKISKEYATRFKTSDYLRHLGQYDTTKGYLGIEKDINGFKPRPGSLIYDKNGIPMVNYYGKYQYNPVNIAQYALSQYSLYCKDKGVGIDKFLRAADKLIELQNENGEYHYGFSFKYYDGSLPVGWMSGMAQGQVLSVLARAYRLTGDSKYALAGNKSFNILTTPIENGGTMATLKDLDPSLKDYNIFEEYIATPRSYTLNGYIFALLGVYDWSKLDANDGNYEYITAENYFNKGISTLKKILPYYDTGGFTTYDLGYRTQNREPNMSGRYHSIHIYLLNAVHSITKDDVFEEYYNKWKSYMEI